MSRKGLGGRAARTSRWLALTAIPLAIVVALGAASASGARTQTGWLPNASGHMQKVIVLLRTGSAGTTHSLQRIGTLHAREASIATTLRSHGATSIVKGTTIPFVVASVSASQKQALAKNAAVKAVFPDSVIPAPTLPKTTAASFAAYTGKASRSRAATPSICGTKSAPENDPEAVGVVKATQANALGFTGKGVKVAYIAGPIDTTIPDFQRNAKYASSGSPAGSPVVTAVDFTGDPANTPNGDAAGESFLDAGSIAAQGNQVFDLSKFVNSSHTLPKGCDITVTGVAPGASVLGLNVFSAAHDTTESNFIQAIDYAASHGVNVLNESFSANNFPDTAIDATRIVDDEAVADGVTVVVSSGDGGIDSTIGSPGTGAKEILSGATTTFRGYEQDFYGGVNATKPYAGNGTWLDNNISSITSAGFAQNGKTIDLVAPGDLNWTPCSANKVLYTCADENGNPVNLQLSGGTSESTPLTSGAAADVIQAYRSTHGGSNPTPALVKQILMSTATDIDAPADQQGAGLLNVLAAVKEARSVNGGKGSGGVLLNPNQINIQQNHGKTATKTVTVTNTSSKSETVKLSTRTLTSLASHQIGSFCLNPDPKNNSVCGGPTANTFQIWSGVTEVYQEETFSVPATKKGSRLNFSATYPNTGQSSLLHVALFDPSGAYAGYSLPQGLGNYANIQVADPKPGTWVAVFFTEQDGATTGAFGTSGEINWQADTWTAGPAGTITPSSLTIAPGKSKTATFSAKSPSTPGDTSQSIVVKTGGVENTIPVTVRTMINTSKGGAFSGLVTGGNGRDNPAQSNTYVFHVPSGKRDIDVSAELADPNDGVVAYLVDPQGDVVASSSNQTFDSTASNVIGTGAVNLYTDKPKAGNWSIVLDWLQPVSGLELSEPFVGSVQFNQVRAKANLPKSGTQLVQGKTYTYAVTVTNTAQSPEMFFLDPRTNANESVPLPDQNGSDQNMSLPLKPGLTFPYYIVPTDTSALDTSLTGSGPVTYDIEPFAGDPDLSPAVPAPGINESQSSNSASLDYAPSSGNVVTGAWYLNPSEIGPYPTTGASSETASATFTAVTKAFDPTVATATGDFWTWVEGFSKGFGPAYLQPGESVQIPLTITPSAASGTKVSGAIKVGDVFQVNYATGFAFGGGDELASLPFSYTVK